ncbi:hypothetical protein BU26DRAFT_421834 [Trematosphaeria pertusa]|uniref:TMEM205-like domain-containing protein n=1 Tax=Trematosphaeria pertusa TaxID=390896 RepID=A0A6A6IMB9_9PLEO|nr:uncharacterized protein BU26DRAFT_421834 [Trematosphaeria pertusa]KAF2251715.1 hypothetical protein BU26DRAFT_421834 [Trematosphaeria pertusa]
MAVFSSFLAPFHLFAYSTLLGTQLYQTFVMVKIAHRALPRDAFTTLQKRVFPAYFRSQSLLLALVAVTLPPHGPMSLAREKADWISFLVAGVTAALNLVVFGPRTSRIMMVRKYQEKIDAQTPVDGFVGDEMKKLNRAFSWNHAMCMHLNLITIGATLWYGWTLASRLRFDAE